jgi:hypothetical protein
MRKPNSWGVPFPVAGLMGVEFWVTVVTDEVLSVLDTLLRAAIWSSFAIPALGRPSLMKQTTLIV